VLVGGNVAGLGGRALDDGRQAALVLVALVVAPSS
jgi:hypothetical protein